MPYTLPATHANRGNVTPTEYYQISSTLVKRDGGWTIVHTYFQVVPEPEAKK